LQINLVTTLLLSILAVLFLSELIYYDFDFSANEFKSFEKFVVDRAAPHFYGFFLTNSPSGIYNFTDHTMTFETLVVAANILQIYQTVVGHWSHLLVLVSGLAGYEIARKAFEKKGKARKTVRGGPKF
jgi:hypothetical protein